MCNLVENFIFRLFVCFVCLFVFVLVSICHMFRHSIVDLVEYSIKRSKTNLNPITNHRFWGLTTIDTNHRHWIRTKIRIRDQI